MAGLVLVFVYAVVCIICYTCCIIVDNGHGSVSFHKHMLQMVFLHLLSSFASASASLRTCSSVSVSVLQLQLAVAYEMYSDGSDLFRARGVLYVSCLSAFG
jgi:hypothetical protein